VRKEKGILKSEDSPFPYTTHKNRLKMVERPKCETGIRQNSKETTGSYLFNLGCSNFFLETSPKAREVFFSNGEKAIARTPEKWTGRSTARLARVVVRIHCYLSS